MRLLPSCAGCTIGPSMDDMQMRSRVVRSVATGVSGGLFSGLVGGGGGVVMIPLLTGFLGMSQHRAHGTSLAIIILVAAAGAMPYVVSGHVDWGLALGLGVTSTVAAMVSARAMVAMPDVWLRRAFALVLLAAAVRMLLG
ncbi:MAG TPA: sulfite exporter TauE/SafE family protein [Dehalococcoidia bacterium]|nr:sulfite exporter TauE/SafE family protein [Dehalococcoidia bacterium]